MAADYTRKLRKLRKTELTSQIQDDRSHRLLCVRRPYLQHADQAVFTAASTEDDQVAVEEIFWGDAA